MVKELYCKNFKIFEEETQVPLSPLTVITGPNNSGKSTLLDLLRLLSTDSDRPLYDIDLSSEDHRNCEFEEVLSNKDSGELSVGYRTRHFASSCLRNLLKDVESDAFLNFDLADDTYIISRFKSLNGTRYLASREVYVCRKDTSGPGQLLFSERHELGDLEEITPKEEREGTGDASEKRGSREELSEEQKQRFEDLVVENAEEAETTPVRYIRFGGPGKAGVIRGETSEHDEWDQRQRQATFTIRDLPHNQDKDYRRRRDTEWTFHAPLWKMALCLLQKKRELEGENLEDFSVGDFSVAMSNRARAMHDPGSRVYSKDEIPRRAVSPFDKSSLRTMLKEADTSLPEWLPPHQEEVWMEMLNDVITPFIEFVDRNTNAEGMHVPSFRARPQRYYDSHDQLTGLLKQYHETEGNRREDVNEWLEAFEIGSELRVDRIGPELLEAHVERNGARRYLSDLGSGSAQLLPLILSVGMRPPARAYIEEPEANLHPDLQARLADLMVKLTERGTQVIVETHSEYLVRRLQYLVARGECPSDRASVTYLNARDIDEKGSPDIRHITIDQDGQLSEPFGPGFFDQATNLMVDLFKYGSDN